MWEILHDGSEPYPDMTPLEAHTAVKSGYKMPLHGDECVPSGVRGIIRDSWSTCPDDRPTLADMRMKLEQAHSEMPVSEKYRSTEGNKTKSDKSGSRC